MRLSLIVQRHQYAALMEWNAAAWASGHPCHLVNWTDAALHAHRLTASAVEMLA
jgi:hypothetical protein